MKGNESATDAANGVMLVCLCECACERAVGEGELGTHWWTSFALLFILFCYDADSCQFGIHWFDNRPNIFARGLERSSLRPHKLQSLPEEKPYILKVSPRQGKNTSTHNFPSNFTVTWTRL